MAISTTQLAVMQTTRQSHLMDTCVHEVYSSTTAAHGEPVASYSDGSTYACGIEMDPGKELQIGADTVKVDVTLHLPLAAYDSIGQADRIRITHRFGVALTTAETYEVIGLPARDSIGLVLDCKRVIV